MTKEEELIEEARKRFPPGTKFRPVHIIDDKSLYCVVRDDKFVVYGDTVYAALDNGTIFEPSAFSYKYGNTHYNRKIYEGSTNTWAEIVGNTIVYNTSLFDNRLKVNDRVQFTADAFEGLGLKDNRDFHIIAILDPTKYYHNIVVNRGEWTDLFNKFELIKW